MANPDTLRVAKTTFVAAMALTSWEEGDPLWAFLQPEQFLMQMMTFFQTMQAQPDFVIRRLLLSCQGGGPSPFVAHDASDMRTDDWLYARASRLLAQAVAQDTAATVQAFQKLCVEQDERYTRVLDAWDGLNAAIPAEVLREYQQIWAAVREMLGIGMDVAPTPRDETPCHLVLTGPRKEE